MGKSLSHADRKLWVIFLNFRERNVFFFQRTSNGLVVVWNAEPVLDKKKASNENVPKLLFQVESQCKSRDSEKIRKEC